jgi:hypothetical protein
VYTSFTNVVISKQKGISGLSTLYTGVNKAIKEKELIGYTHNKPEAAAGVSEY